MAYGQDNISTVKLSEVRMRDANVLPDKETGTYYITSSARNAGVRVYTSKDLVNWEGPHIVYRTPDEMWGKDVEINSIWAPEMHKYKGKYYLFLTFSSSKELPEQWDEWFQWLPRVRRASQVLVSDSPLGPFEPFSNEPTLPKDMMTLDGTLWEEDGRPYMVFCQEWVQVVDGSISMVQLTEDLSETVGDTKVLFRGSAAPWAPMSTDHGIGSWVTDAPWLYRSKSGKLFMLWSGYNDGVYTSGIAISDSGKLAGPWKQQAEPVYSDDGGHPSLFTTFDGTLMMALHSPNSDTERMHLFEMEDTGETLRVVREFTGGE
ncbi:glycoside hydrolase family 43 protein [Aliifodinibius sp. S!AR15-10]|uniref:glycoside hydrolase family 43 protein n=1 Tax=Aliifodinibius sp. S!AR15-10 TaxID=2950437 RepID=UPI002864E776|nr:glycoside hydrolase family 43 protein [Aliifodinibius sp. S!AR15-10]MDR8392431.1 glycoside hydrolase family 43 protein [Aliifodinibius sp. S!AR15-10]